MARFNLTYSRKSLNPLRCDGFLYTVKQGDTLYKISQREQIALEKIITANPQIKNPDEIKPGDRICIPRGEHNPNPNPKPSSKPDTKPEPKPDPKPDKQFLSWRFALLMGTSESPDSLGFAIVKPREPAWVAVVGFNLPEPSSFDEDFDTYKAWVIESRTYSRFRLDMQKIADGIWLAEGKNGDLSEFDQIIVTPETTPGITTPTGPAVLEGRLTGA